MRTYGKLKLSVQSDPEWRQLSHTAQWLYWALVGNENLTACGAMDWKPKHIAALSPTINLDGVESALEELRAYKYVVLDEETDELLLRSFVRNDDVVHNKNMMVAVIKAWRKLASLHLRGVVVHELLRLKQESPQYAIWEHLEMIDALRRTQPVNVFDSDAPDDQESVPASWAEQSSVY
ncbi:helix-turn-helix DNA binding domain protein [Arthrobacter phage BarretLemon]|uniref:Helix-turn-helix DNA binding domain protein n=1 Tax=Arthrobacter phage BarretLemon TaxID=1796994 RepID=A0A140G766_9CAUD|nr:replication initiation protein [Arthrobacter phage BarretLemon]AMM44501.1 helix-turn-helix DNA binding domain protein [Arthrobacter phage BarretLemon]